MDGETPERHVYGEAQTDKFAPEENCLEANELTARKKWRRGDLATP